MNPGPVGNLYDYEINKSLMEAARKIHKKLKLPGGASLDNYAEAVLGIKGKNARQALTTLSRADRKEADLVDNYIHDLLEDIQGGIIDKYNEELNQLKLHDPQKSHGIEMENVSEAKKEHEKKEIIRRNNNIILWCWFMDELCIPQEDGRVFDARKYEKEFFKHKSVVKGLKSIFIDMYPSIYNWQDYKAIDMLKKTVRILVFADEKGSSLESIKSYAIETLGSDNEYFDIEVTSKPDPVDYDIIYFIVESENQQVAEQEATLRFYLTSRDKNGIESKQRVKIFVKSSIEDKIQPNIPRAEKKAFEDEDVFLLSLVKDINHIKNEYFSNVAWRFNKRLAKLKEYAESSKLDELKDNAESKETKEAWESVLTYGTDLLDNAKEIYTGYLKEQGLLIENNLSNVSLSEETIKNAFDANVDEKYFEDILTLLNSSKDERIKGKTDDIIKASKDHMKGLGTFNLKVGKYHLKKTEYKEAEAYLKDAYNISELLSEDEAELKMDSICRLIEVYWRLKRYQEAENLIRFNESYINQKYEEDKEKYYLYQRDIKHYNGNILHFRRILEDKKSTNKYNRVVATAISELKDALEAIKTKYPDIEEFDSNDLTNNEKKDAAAKYSMTCNNLGIVYRRLKNYRQSEKYYDISLKLKEALEDHRGLCMIHRNKASLIYLLGNTESKEEECDKRFKEASNELNNINGDETDRKKANYYYNYDMARYCLHMGWYDEAEKYINKADEKFKSFKKEEQLSSYKNEYEKTKADIKIAMHFQNNDIESGITACDIYKDILKRNMDDETEHVENLSVEDKFNIELNLIKYYRDKDGISEYEKYIKDMAKALKVLLNSYAVYYEYPNVIEAVDILHELPFAEKIEVEYKMARLYERKGSKTDQAKYIKMMEESLEELKKKHKEFITYPYIAESINDFLNEKGK
ncbi:MAG: tetratricopeptide repeat protein [Lachnospiraceae bacterium]|nr:tetratricopeptide repeat protein [Lachnospiraceae bacterium]